MTTDNSMMTIPMAKDGVLGSRLPVRYRKFMPKNPVRKVRGRKRLAMTVRAFRGHFSPEHHHGVELGGIYWHFVDVMWIVVYVTVYVL